MGDLDALRDLPCSAAWPAKDTHILASMGRVGCTTDLDMYNTLHEMYPVPVDDSSPIRERTQVESHKRRCNRLHLANVGKPRDWSTLIDTITLKE